MACWPHASKTVDTHDTRIMAIDVVRVAALRTDGRAAATKRMDIVCTMVIYNGQWH